MTNQRNTPEGLPVVLWEVIETYVRDVLVREQDEETGEHAILDEEEARFIRDQPYLNRSLQEQLKHVPEGFLEAGSQAGLDL